MSYKVILDVSFNNKQDAEDLLNYIETIKSNANEGSARYHVCHHDDVDSDPCNGYVDVDLNGEVIEHQL